jgi:cathepsin X
MLKHVASYLTGDPKASQNNRLTKLVVFSLIDKKCKAVKYFPNATIATFGKVSGHHAIQHELYRNGPLACSINADPLLHYHSGIVDNPRGSKIQDHAISIVGWGLEKSIPYWVVRNSWGEYWGEQGYFRIKRGENQLGIEQDCSWAMPGAWTE